MINIYIMKNDITRIVLIVAGAAVLFYLITVYNNRRLKASEGLTTMEMSEQPNYVNPSSITSQEQITLQNPNIVTPESEHNGEPRPAEPGNQNELYTQVGSFDDSLNPAGNQFPKDGFPKDQLTPGELLPSDINSKWSQVNPTSKGNLGDQNFLTAAYHVGINTVGQTMRNANLQLRSEPPNPQKKVSPWGQTTIEPDTNRRPLEIGGAC